MAYSYKTNYAPAICRQVRDLGADAEVVSEMEYEMALQVGHRGEEIIVNGPLHSRDFLERALLAGSRVNLDSWYMLDHLDAICHSHPQQQFSIGVRLNYDIVEGGASRFGFVVNDATMARLHDRLDRLPNVAVVGLHSHFSQSSRSAASFRSRVRGMLAAARRYFSGTSLEYLNFGGGLPGKMPESLRRQHEDPVPTCAEIAEAVAGTLAEALPAAPRPTLFLEPGTAVVCDAMEFVCRVHDVKHVGGRALALVDASNHNVNHKSSLALPIRVLRRSPDGEASVAGCESFDVVSYTCIETDYLCRDVPGPIAPGDHIVFEYVGGYSNVLKQPFIRPCPPIIARRDGQYEIAKRQETVNDVLATYV
ncbi:MAG: hypothetical protein AAF657_17145 [Acidobacteriota bacterium]